MLNKEPLTKLNKVHSRSFLIASLLTLIAIVLFYTYKSISSSPINFVFLSYLAILINIILLMASLRIILKDSDFGWRVFAFLCFLLGLPALFFILALQNFGGI